MDDTKFFQLAAHIKKITDQYQSPKGAAGHLLHHQYAAEYDIILEKFGYTKKRFIDEVTLRLAIKNGHQENPQTEKTPPKKARAPKNTLI